MICLTKPSVSDPLAFTSDKTVTYRAISNQFKIRILLLSLHVLCIDHSLEHIRYTNSPRTFYEKNALIAKGKNIKAFGI